MKVKAYIGNIYKCLEKDDKVIEKGIRYVDTKKPFYICGSEFLSKQQMYKEEAIIIKLPHNKYIDLNKVNSVKRYKDLIHLSELYYPEEFGIMRSFPIDNDDLFVDENSLKDYSKGKTSIKRLIKANKRK